MFQCVGCGGILRRKSADVSGKMQSCGVAHPQRHTSSYLSSSVNSLPSGALLTFVGSCSTVAGVTVVCDTQSTENRPEAEGRTSISQPVKINWRALWKNRTCLYISFFTHHSMVFNFQCSVYWWNGSVRFGIRTFRSSVFSLLGAKVPTENFRSRERKFPGTFAPENESSRELTLPGAKVLGNFRSRERKFPGTFAPGIVSSHFFITNTVYYNYQDSKRSKYAIQKVFTVGLR